MSVKYQNDIHKLTKKLTNNLKGEFLKTRAIFRWITYNIKYDFKQFNKYNYKGKEPRKYKCNDQSDCESKQKEFENELILKVLNSRKAVCSGYSLLFIKMCEIIGVHTEVVSGYVRDKYYQVGTVGTLDHAWNAVLIDNNYYLLDPTWASGFCSETEDGKLIKFCRCYNNYYWLTKPEDFIRNHYPEKPEWTLVSGYSKEKFSTNPFYANGIIEYIQLIHPASGTIEAKKGDTIHFKFRYSNSIHDLQINSNIFQNPDIWEEITKGRKKQKVIDSISLKKQLYVNFERRDDLYQFEYVVTNSSLYYLDILFDYQRAMRFKVTIKE